MSSKRVQDVVSKLGQGLILDAESNYLPAITEEELTSRVVLNTEETIKASQIILSEGKTHLYGTITALVRTTVTAIPLMEADASQAQTTVESMTFGGVPIEEAFAETLGR